MSISKHSGLSQCDLDESNKGRTKSCVRRDKDLEFYMKL
jgi:hypothetical protein